MTKNTRAKITYYWIKQRSETWYNLRKNLWTGSTIIELLKGKTTIPEFSDYDNLYMKRGRMLESLAIEAYICETYINNTKNIGNVKFPGFVTNSKYPNAGYSPDGLDGNILLEVKCLNGEHHEDLVRGNIPPQYMAQIQFGLMITGHKYAKLIAYNPDSSNGLAVILIKRDMRIRNNIKKKLLMVAKNN